MKHSKWTLNELRATVEMAETNKWNERFAEGTFLYGTAANAFVIEQSGRIAAGSRIVDIGSGEGRNAVYFAEQGFDVTAVDYAPAALEKVRKLAASRKTSVETILVNVLAWSPSRRWDAAVMAYLHLKSAERPTLYRQVHSVVRPGGLLIAEWFRPEQVLNGYQSGGPSNADWLVSAEELRKYFDDGGLLLLEEAEVILDEGPAHQGPAAVVRMVWQRPRLA